MQLFWFAGDSIFTCSLSHRAAPGAGEGRGRFKDRPTAGSAGCDLLPEHPSDHRPASCRAAGAGAGACPAAYRLEAFRPALDRLYDNALADFVAEANGTVRVDDRLFPGFPNFVGLFQVACLLRSRL